jgi:hypothetical protein
MRTTIRRGSDDRQKRGESPSADVPKLKRLAKRLRHTARLAGMALEGNDPSMGVDYLYDALDMLRDELRPMSRARRATA